MPDPVLVTGGTGFIGRVLVNRLIREGYSPLVLSRNPRRARRILPGIECVSSLGEIPSGHPIMAIVNLAGTSIAGRPWTKRYKEILRTSRIETTEALVAWTASRPQPPKVLVSASAIGFYGDRGEESLTEGSGPGKDFGARLCLDWEEAALVIETLGVRLVRLRIGLVLGDGGGLLRALVRPLLLGLGSVMGTGRQWMSWIHMDDLVELTLTALRDPAMSGAYNATAPCPATQEDFIRTLGRIWRRPVFLRVPAWPIRHLLGEMSEIFLEGQKVLPHRALSEGFHFAFPSLSEALEDIHG